MDKLNTNFTFNFVTKDKLLLDLEKLNKLEKYCEEEESDELIVYAKGQIFHNNFTGTNQPIALNSITKVFSSVAIGLLIDDGLIDSLDLSMSYFYPHIKELPIGQVTIRHILTHSSGIRTLGHDNELSSAPNTVNYVLSLDLESEPGTVSKYNNEATALLSGVVEKLSGNRLDVYLNEKLFRPLGIKKWEWLKDKNNNPFPYAGLSITGLDLAKFAYFFLKEGMWNGENLLSKMWINESTRPTQTLDRDWGYLWLTSFLDDEYVGYGMSGFGGKYIYVSPKEDFFAIRLVHNKKGEITPEAPDFFKLVKDMVFSAS